MFQLFLKNLNDSFTGKLEKSRKKKLKELLKKLKIDINNLKLLDQALTHASFVERKNFQSSYERLEFLGDSILNASVSALLYELCPKSKEGSLSALRASIIDEKTLSQVALKLDLLSYVNLGKGETLSDSRAREKVSADVMEAIIGVVFLEKGFREAFKVVKSLLESEINTRIKTGPRDFKTQLQKISVARFKEYPKYEIIKEEGPEHNKIFEVSVSINNNQYYATGTGRTKKEAEQKAAKKILSILKEEKNS